MRLLDTFTGQFVEKDPGDSRTQYAILSHTWNQDGEQSYKQLKKIQKRHPPKAQAPFIGKRDSERLLPGPIWKDPELSRKIRDACAYARADGFRYIWIDSCCIDKTSSSELSEAINSMYAWYGRADVCYAYLADVPTDEDHRKDGSRFSRSRWFTRGWTLQELLAPPHVVFLSRDWKPLGSKLALVELVHRTTNISPEALLEPQSLDTFGVAQRLSWAAKRETTRAEDRAYSLLGLFDINMPILYGEGERAFRRLQEEIMRRIPDQSLFAWLDGNRSVCSPEALDPGPTAVPQAETSDQDGEVRIWACQETQPRHVHSLLALSLAAFEERGRLMAIPYDEVFQRLPGQRLHLPAPDYAFTPLGIRTQVPVIPFSHILPPNVRNAPGNLPLSQSYLVILGCEHKDHPGCLLGRICCIPPSTSGVEFLYCGFVEASWQWGRREGENRPQLEYTENIELFPISPSTIARCARHIELKAVYICHPHRPSAVLEGARNRPHEAINLLFSEESRSALRRLGGYTARLENPDQEHPRTHRLTLSNDRHAITVVCQHALERDGRRLTVKACVALVQLPDPDAIGSQVDVTDASGSPARRTGSTKAALSWTDSVPWAPMLWNSKGVSLDAGAGAKIRVNLHLDFVVTNHYVLHVEVRND